MAIFDFLKKNMYENCTETEAYVKEALNQLSQGNDGDATYHPLYKAWRSFQQDPSQLKAIQDYGKYGMGLMIFLTYGTVSDIDDIQQLASISYLFLSKAIKENPSNGNLIKNRLLLMILNHEAFEYTVSSVVNKDQSPIYPNYNPFKARDAMYKMEYADLSRDSRLLGIDMLNKQYRNLRNKIQTDFFGKNETESTIIAAGNRHHNDVLAHLEQMVIEHGIVLF